MTGEQAWLRWAVAGLLVLVFLAPVFGWAAAAVDYAEPLENAAAATGAADAARATAVSLLPGYGVPGLGSAPGTLVAALLGTVLTLVAAGGTGRLLER
jgi:cobalt/nickel transport protein